MRKHDAHFESPDIHLEIAIQKTFLKGAEGIAETMDELKARQNAIVNLEAEVSDEILRIQGEISDLEKMAVALPAFESLKLGVIQDALDQHIKITGKIFDLNERKYALYMNLEKLYLEYDAIMDKLEAHTSRLDKITEQLDSFDNPKNN
jgi:chromosome segregation ATPase